jgi:UDP-GlcNAc:undecaprenyl-phosphate GlcNAc-1-phosphate transferase
MVLLTTLLLSLFITLVMIPILKSYAMRLHTVDFPNGRSIHSFPIPKIGGIAMALGMMIPVLLWSPKGDFTSSLLAGGALVSIFGFIDDQRDLGYKTKFAGQICAALIVILHGGVVIRSLGGILPDGMLLPLWLAVPLTVLVIVGVTNAINLSDGLDGLAGGISLLCFSCIGIIAYQVGNYTIATIAVAVVGAIFAFLRFNTYPAVIFMGDAGSLLLGFLAVTLSLGLSQGHTPVSPLFPLLLLGFPILDTLRVMVERVSARKSPFVADNNHFHHKLIQQGYPHSKAVVTIYLLQALLVVCAFVFRFHSEWLLLSVYLIFCAAVMSWFMFATKSTGKSHHPHPVELIFQRNLQIIREKSIVIKVAYWAVLICLPATLHFTALLPARIASPFPTVALCLAGYLLLIMLFRPDWLQFSLRVSFYFLILFLVYQCQVEMVPWLAYKYERLYNLNFLFLVTAVIVMLKFTRRQNGFRTTPTDFLILFIALIVPNLPDAHIQSYRMGLFAAKLIALLFSFEVLLGELRGELNGLSLHTVAALMIVFVRGLI